MDSQARLVIVVELCECARPVLTEYDMCEKHRAEFQAYVAGVIPAKYAPTAQQWWFDHV